MTISVSTVYYQDDLISKRSAASGDETNTAVDSITIEGIEK